MKTLYVSDLDGTLLRSDETTSTYTNQVINELVEKGMLFSYATARSYHTAHKVTKGLQAKIPLIVYNGAFIKDNVTGEILIENGFQDDVRSVIDDLIQHDIYPTVYSLIDTREKFSYVKAQCSEGMLRFLQTRQGDNRDNPVLNIQDLYQGKIFYISCIDDKEKLKPLYEKYRNQYHCLYHTDIYTQDQWLEIMSLSASKANAIEQLKGYLHCDRVVAFRDGINDIDMFDLADECYAVDNAVDELKAMATDVIGNHNDDSVAKWLLQHYQE